MKCFKAKPVIFAAMLFFLLLALTSCGDSSNPKNTEKDDEVTDEDNVVTEKDDAVTDEDSDTAIETDSDIVETCKENEARDCYDGPQNTASVGECKKGRQTCVNGFWGACEDQVLPKEKEICDEKDHNCDTNPMDGFDLTKDPENCGICGKVCEDTYEHASPICKDSKCAAGPCDGGWYGENCDYKCTYIGETDNNCDGFDDNCDGTKDEGHPKNTIENCGACGNNCVTNVQAKYRNTVVATCNQNKVCEYECMLYQHNPDSDWATGCEYQCTPSKDPTEICDQKDNNCNNQIDEGLSCSCNENETQSCTVKDTYCEGTQKCVSGAWTECANTNPKTGIEKCDKLDNNCDLKIDEPFMNSTQTIYSHKEHCGDCDKPCLDAHTSSNECLVSGTCKPICSEGFNNIDSNKWNGCESGCEYSFKLESMNSYKTLLESVKDIDRYLLTNSVFDGTNLSVISKKRDSSTTYNVFFSKFDLTGAVVMAPKKITDVVSGKEAGDPDVAYYNNKYFVLYRSDEDENTEIYYRAYDEKMEPLNTKVNVSNTTLTAYYPNISKKTYGSKIPFVWHESGTKNSVHIRTINALTNELNNDEKTYSYTGSANYHYKYPVVTHTEGEFAILYCGQTGTDKSALKLKVMSQTFTKILDIDVATFTNTYCGINNYLGYNITTENINSPTDRYFYVSLIDDSGNILVKKYNYSGTTLTARGVTYKVTKGTTDSFYATSLNIYDGKLVLGYSNKNTPLSTNINYVRILGATMAAHGAISTMRYIPSKHAVTYDINSFYTDKGIIFQYMTSPNTYNNIDMTVTKPCEN